MRRALHLFTQTQDSPRMFWVCLVFLFLVVLALHGKTVPFNNEYIYLLRLQPGFLPNDWTFAQAANEHWLFNTIFSLPAHLFSIETIGWAGRVACWLLCLGALLRLGRRWEIPYIAIVISIGAWLAFGQSVVNAEWIFGTFEAKTVAYVCLLFALDQFAGSKFVIPSVLLGLAFSFHPAVGLWAIPAVGLALLAQKVAIRDLATVAVITFVFTLPGILPLILEQAAPNAASPQNWEFIVRTHMPFHFDPFYFSGIGVGVLAVMLAFNLVVLWGAEGFGLKFIRNFQIGIAAFFALGVVLRFFEIYPALRFMPMRLFPILTPLFFLFTGFYLFRRTKIWPVRAAAAAVMVVAIGMLHPIDEAIGQMREVKASWVAEHDDLERSLLWISQNTSADAVILTSPANRKYWYLSQRAQVVSYSYPRYERLSEWFSRIDDVTGNAHIPDRGSAKTAIDTGFESLTTAGITALKEKHSATHLLTRAVYPFPVIFETGGYKVYSLP